MAMQNQLARVQKALLILIMLETLSNKVAARTSVFSHRGLQGKVEKLVRCEEE
jgi:hypothetical protein